MGVLQDNLVLSTELIFICYLPAGKNCDRGLENAARGRRPRTAFSSPRSQFFTIRTDPKPANNLFIFSCDKIGSQV